MAIHGMKALATAVAADDWPEVERLCRGELVSRPEDEGLWVTLALAMHRLQKPAEALEVFDRLTKSHARSSLHWDNYATALFQAGLLDRAERAVDVLVSLEPNEPKWLIKLGVLRMQRRDYVGARNVLVAAHVMDRASPTARIHAARACNFCRDYEDVEGLLQPWAEWSSLDDELQLELGSLLLGMGDGQAAVGLIQVIVLRSPENMQALLQLGVVYERLNRLAEAQSLCAQLTARSAALGDGPRTELARLEARLALRRGDLALSRAALESIDPHSHNDFAHYFVLATVYDKQGEAGLAMQTLHVAHGLQVADLESVLPDGASLDDGIFASTEIRVSEADYNGWQQTGSPEAEYSPVFIVGFPRSGTTLLEQMLDAHPRLQSMDEQPLFSQLAEMLHARGVRVPQDLFKLGESDCDELRKRYLDMVCRVIPRRWDAQLVDKNPLNMLRLPLIHRLFPYAKFIFALRHPCDVILSCYMQNFRSPPLIGACRSLERLATAYVSTMESWIHHASVFEPNVMTLRYEELVGNLPQQAQRIADFLDLADASPLTAFDEHARNKGYIGTPSYTQVIQPMNRKGLDRWGAYRSAFESLLPVLEPMLRHWGYSDQPDAQVLVRR